MGGGCSMIPETREDVRQGDMGNGSCGGERERGEGDIRCSFKLLIALHSRLLNILMVF